MLMSFLRAAASGLFALGAASAQPGVVAITNGSLHMTSPAGDVIEGGTILIRAGRIAAVGTDIEIPEGATIIDAGGRPVTPGLFAPLSAIGLTEIGAVEEANDESTDNDALSAALRAVDGFNYDTTVIDVTRAGGVTRAFVAPAVGPTLFSGCGMVIAMVRTETMVTEPCIGQVADLGERAARRAGGSRQAGIAMFRRALNDAIAYQEDPEEYADIDAAGRLSLEDARALAPAAQGQERLFINVSGASDIRRVLEISEEFGLDIVLVGAEEAYRLADAIAAAEVPVILNPLANLPDSFETMGATMSAAARLASAGVSVAFYDAGTGYTHNVRLLAQLAGNAVAEGMAHAEALRAITLTPAEIVGLGRDLGTLERGKLADVVIWDGDPLEITTRPTEVFIAGEATSLENRQRKLAERYKDLGRGDRPFQYRN